MSKQTEGFKTLEAILRMAKDDNQGLRMTTTLVDVRKETRGSVVGFGTEPICGDDAELQIKGLPGKYIACAFFIERTEMEKYLNNNE